AERIDWAVAVYAFSLSDSQLRAASDQRVLSCRVVLFAAERLRVLRRIVEGRLAVSARCVQREQMQEVVRGRVTVGQGLHPEQTLDRGEHRGVVVAGVVDHPPADQWGDH